ncbi:hypothetical protein IAT40_007146 [Kwoniella sp. CBS 6097]
MAEDPYDEKSVSSGIDVDQGQHHQESTPPSEAENGLSTAASGTTSNTPSTSRFKPPTSTSPSQQSQLDSQADGGLTLWELISYAQSSTKPSHADFARVFGRDLDVGSSGGGGLIVTATTTGMSGGAASAQGTEQDAVTGEEAEAIDDEKATRELEE